MPFVQAKCPECGGMLAVDDSKKAANCQFCGEAFIVHEAINNYNTYNTYNTSNTTNHNYGEGAVVNVYENQNSVSSLLKRAFMFLEDGDFVNADEYCDKVLDIVPENAQAYLGKLMAELKVRKQENLKNCSASFSYNKNYQKILHFGDSALKDNLSNYIENINEKVEKSKIELIEKNKHAIKLSSLISAGWFHVVGLKTDGTVVAAGYNPGGRCDVSSWKNIVGISAGGGHTVGLKSDGTVVAVGSNDYGQCNVSDWTDVIEISAGISHTVGLKSDGTVVAVGLNDDGRCNVSDWTNVVAISAWDDHTVGLKSDGRVVAVGHNNAGECDVSYWTNVVAISACRNHTVGLKSDGRVVAVGYNSYGQCNVSDWTNIIAISEGDFHTVGLKSNGTVVAVGSNYQCQCNVESWTDIVAISAGFNYTIGLKFDGTIVAVGAIDDGYVCHINGQKIFDDINNLDAEREHKIAEVQATIIERKSKGLCQHCGGEFKGLFSKKCAKCGKEKDY